MRKYYNNPEIKIISLDSLDVIKTSGDWNNNGGRIDAEDYTRNWTDDA